MSTKAKFAAHEAYVEKLKQDNERLRLVMMDAAALAAGLGSGATGTLRGHFMSVSNCLNAALGRRQSSHGSQFDNEGKVIKPDPLNEIMG